MTIHARARPVTIARIAVLACATVVAYANTLRAAFLFDDFNNIVSNKAIHSLSNFTSLGRLLDASRTPTNLVYATAVRPVAYLTFALNWAIGGADQVGFHLLNLAIHLASALLVYALTRALLRTPALGAGPGPVDAPRSTLEEWAPLLAALLFACHPLQTEAVTYITQRFASLAALFYLGAVLCHVRGRLQPGGSARLRAGALALALLAMTTKELSATLPVVLLGVEIVFFGSTLRSAARRVWPFLLVVAVIPLLTFYAGHRVGDASLQAVVARGQHVPPALHYLLTQTTVLVMYLRLLFWPAGLNFDYDYPLYTSLGEPRVLASAALLVGLLAASLVVLARARRRRDAATALAAFGVLWFLVTSAVESSVVPLADLVDEYRCYLPSVGVAWAVVLGVLRAVEGRPAWARRAAVAGLGVAAALLATATYLRNDVYRDGVTLWEDTVAKSPLKPRPRTNLSIAYGKAGREEDSIIQYQAAAYLNPEFRRAHGKLGVRQEEFEQVMRGAAARFVQRHLTSGMAALDRRDLALAETEFRLALRLDPADPDVHSNLGLVHGMRREFDDAVREAREAVRLAPQRADLARNLGVALSWSGRPAEALEALRRAVALDPADAQSSAMIEQLTGRR
jgi:tetratricopeptide (TPR) repeat protein